MRAHVADGMCQHDVWFSVRHTALVGGVEVTTASGRVQTRSMHTEAAVLEGNLGRPAVHKRLRIRRILAQEELQVQKEKHGHE